MKWKFNYLSLLSLLSVIGILGFFTENKGFWGFFGFLVYVRYFSVVPDEMFQLNVRKAATISFFTEIISLVFFVFLFVMLYQSKKGLPMAFEMSFAVAIILFSICLTVLEWREMKGAEND